MKEGSRRDKQSATEMLDAWLYYTIRKAVLYFHSKPQYINKGELFIPH